jgi:hypothetical protein
MRLIPAGCIVSTLQMFDACLWRMCNLRAMNVLNGHLDIRGQALAPPQVCISVAEAYRSHEFDWSSVQAPPVDPAPLPRGETMTHLSAGTVLREVKGRFRSYVGTVHDHCRGQDHQSFTKGTTTPPLNIPTFRGLSAIGDNIVGRLRGCAHRLIQAQASTHDMVRLSLGV